MASQNDLIGPHPAAPDIFMQWLKCDDIKPTKTKCHRSLTELIPASSEKLVNWLAERLIFHHYDQTRLDRLKAKYAEVGFPEYAKLHRKLPNSDKTKKGNATEILLIEYIEACQNKPLIKAYKLRFNPNVDQAIKGDDVLMVDLTKDKKDNDQIKIFLGEAKFRQTPAKAVVDDISDSLSKDKLPLSYSFLLDELNRDPKTEKLADLLDKFLIAEIKDKNGLFYAGLLLSNKDAARIVETNLSNDNPSLVFISAGIKNPDTLIDNAFAKAEAMLLNPTAL